jgi:succinate dehydrogenase / fumarate reductase cytochrome b subunit
MHGVLSLYESSVGKKIMMAVTGFILIGFVFVHMLGNLKVYLGEAHFNEYAEFLREVGSPVLPHGALLWIARIALLACVGWHMLAALQVYLMSRSARTEKYKVNHSLSFSYASRTMRWGGLIVVAFVIFHILDLTLGTANPEFVHGSAYQNLVASFSRWYVAAFYILAMIPLGFHLYHGLWSACQTLDINHPRIRGLRRPFSALIAIAIVIGNCSVPLAVLTKVVQ